MVDCSLNFAEFKLNGRVRTIGSYMFHSVSLSIAKTISAYPQQHPPYAGRTAGKREAGRGAAERGRVFQGVLSCACTCKARRSILPIFQLPPGPT